MCHEVVLPQIVIVQYPVIHSLLLQIMLDQLVLHVIQDVDQQHWLKYLDTMIGNEPFLIL
jgi:hypothetical protein